MWEASDIHTPQGFHGIPCISSYLGDDTMMLPPSSHLSCVCTVWVQRSVKGHGSSAMQVGCILAFAPCIWDNIGG